MRRIYFLLTLALALALQAKAQGSDYAGQAPDVTGATSYYLWNVGQKQFLSSTDGQLTLGGSPLAVTVKTRDYNNDFGGATDGYVTITSADGNLAASPFLRPRSDGNGKYSEWTLQPTGTDNNYTIACRFHDSNVSAYLYHSVIFGYPHTMLVKPAAAFTNGQWRFVLVANASQTIILDEAATEYTKPTLNDGIATATVQLKRNFTLGSWNTFCVPFAIDNTQLKAQFGDDVKVAQFTGVNATTLLFTSTTSVEAGVPYIIKPTKDHAQGTDYYEFSGVTSFADAPHDVEQTATADNGGATVTFHASFSKTTAPERAFVIRRNRIYHLTSAMAMKGFRGYFEETTGSGAKAITDWTLDATPTAINGVEAEAASGSKTYNLQGQQVDANGQLPHGVYIVNGKKVIK